MHIFSRLTGLLDHTGQLAEFIRAGGASVVVQVINRLIMLVVGALLARVLGAHGYGVYAYALAILTVLVLFADLGVAQLTVRESAALVAKGRWPEAKGIVLAAGQVTLVLSVCIGGLGFLLTQLLPQTDQSQVLGLVFLLLPLSALVRFNTSVLRGIGRITTGQAIERLGMPIAVLAGLALVFYFQPLYRTAHFAVAVQIGAAALVVLAGWILLAKAIPPGPRVPYKPIDYLKRSAPFALIGGVGILNSQVDILMLGYFVEAEEIGLYRVAILGSALVGFGLQAANVVLPTLFSRLQALGDQVQLQRLVTLSARLILLSALPIAAVLWLVGDWLATLVFGKEFAESYAPMAVLAVGELVGASMGSMGFLLYMSGEEKPALRILAITAGVNVVLNVLLIPAFGMVGAAIATAIGQGLRLMLLYQLVVKRLALSPWPFKSLADLSGTDHLYETDEHRTDEQEKGVK